MKENLPFTYFLLRYMLGFLAVVLGYRSSIGDYHLLYDQVEIDRLKLDWGPAFFDVDTCNSKENPYLISRYFNQNSNLIEGGIVGS